MEKLKQTIDIKFALTILLLVVSIVSNYYSFKGQIDINLNEIEEIKLARVIAWDKFEALNSSQQERQEKQYREILEQLKCLDVIKDRLGI